MSSRLSVTAYAFALCVCLLLLPAARAALDVGTGPEHTRPDLVQRFTCEPGKVCRERTTQVPLRVLPRSFSRIYDSYQDGSVIDDNVRAFHPLYVFQHRRLNANDPSAGWYQVGANALSEPLGWMRATDVLEWRQALIVSYTHHGTGEEARQKVLMFRSLAPLKEVVESSDMERTAVGLYRALGNGDALESIVSKEPETFVDIMKTFYVMPVVEFEKFYLRGEDARYLKVAAAVPGSRGAGEVVNAAPERKDAKGLGVDVVFVMDMTKSMQPYMDFTKQALVRLARLIDTEYGRDLNRKVRFGLVGYRDDTRATPELEFVSRHFTPSLTTARELVGVLADQARAADVSSLGYSEEMFAGVNTALSETVWSEDSVKILVVVGDASSHPAGHPQNTTQLDATALRGLARDRQIHIMTIHLKDKGFASDHAAAQTQFETLAQVAGSDGRAYVDIDVAEPGQFLAAVERITEKVGERLQGLGTGEQPGKTPAAGSKEGPSARAEAAFDRIFDAALVEYLGRETNPPTDFTAWAVDRDLTDPARRTLDVRMLINRKQLSDLVVGLDTVIKSLDYVGMTQAKFLAALQALAAQAEKDPAQIAQAHRLADTGLLPAFIEGLPYTSEVLSLTLEQFAEMTAEHKSGLEGRLRAKLQQYRAINEDVSGWKKLNESDSQADMVYPLSLDALP